MTRLLKHMLIFFFLFSGHALAQEEAEKSSLIQFVEEKLSTENRQIRLNGIQGTLSSNVSFNSITIADADGVWLTINEPQLIWSRTSLLRGRLEIESLTATSIDIPRGPIADESMPKAETGGGISVPELPVAVILGKLEVPVVRFGAALFGLETEISVAGDLTLDSGSLKTNFDINRLDGPGGALQLAIDYDGGKQAIDLDVNLNEPENGILANALKIEGKPPVALSIIGNAPIDELRVALALDVDKRRIINGNLRLDGIPDGLRIRADLGGPLASILPADYASFLGKASQIKADAVRTNAGAISIDSFKLNSGTIDLTANANLLADGFLSELSLAAAIADPSSPNVKLPGGAASFTAADIKIDYDAKSAGAFSQILSLKNLEADGIAVDDIVLRTNGEVVNFADAASRSIRFLTRGNIAGIQATDPKVASAIGSDITVDGSGLWSAGNPLEISKFDIEGETFAVRTNGNFQAGTFDGQIGLQAANLAPFSALAGRDLGGALGIVADGTIGLFTRAFDLNFSGVGNGLTVGIPAADKLLVGASNLSGGVARGTDGVEFNRFRVTNNQADIVLDGSYSSDLSDLEVRVDLRNLADISDAGTGLVSALVTLDGTTAPYALAASVKMPEGILADKSVEALALTFNGQLGGPEFSGDLSGSGQLGGQPISLDGKIRQNETLVAIENLIANIGGAALNADIIRTAQSGLIDGTARINATDISSLAALALVDASGGLNADVKLANDGGIQSADITAKATNLRYQNYLVGSADINAAVNDLLGKPKVDASLDAADLALAGTQIRSISGDIVNNGSATDFDVDAQLAQENARIQTKGRLTQNGAAQIVDLQTLSLQSNLGDASLQRPAQITMSNGTTTISPAQLNIAGGSLTVQGSVSDQLNINADIASLPLSIANAFNASLGLDGVIQGQISTRGPLKSPQVEFNISGNGVTARQLGEAQISPLALSTSGTADLAGKKINLRQLNINNAQEIQIAASGTIPFAGAGLNVNAAGTAPLNIAERFLESRGAKVSGLARFDIAATGALSAPQLSGLLSVAGGELTDPLSNLKLTNIGLIAGLNGDTISIRQMNAQLASGGSVSASGNVGISGDLPADIKIALQNARYSDGQTFATTVNGQLAITGALVRDPLLSGRIDVGETEITIPESFASSSDLLDIRHIDPDAATSRTLERIAKASPLPKPSARPSILQLDLNINAPARIFVRGRGLDAELGGTILLRGPVTNLTPTGRFELRRGRLSLLGQRFDLDEGSVTLTGSLDPMLDFTVRTISGDVTAYIYLTGRASDLQVTFGSDPELPQDEVLAQIIFGQSLSDLSPTQIARLASVAIELTGGNSPGLIDGIRGGLGLDDLDIVNDADGNAAVKVGKYVNDNIYLGVQAGQETEATINLDITDSLTARGTASSSGETSLGIFFEKDY